MAHVAFNLRFDASEIKQIAARLLVSDASKLCIYIYIHTHVYSLFIYGRREWGGLSRRRRESYGARRAANKVYIYIYIDVYILYSMCVCIYIYIYISGVFAGFTPHQK